VDTSRVYTSRIRMSLSQTEVPEQSASEEVREKRDRIVEEAVGVAARRMDADEREQEVLEEVAESIAERLTSPVVESADSEETEAVERLFLDR